MVETASILFEVDQWDDHERLLSGVLQPLGEVQKLDRHLEGLRESPNLHFHPIVYILISLILQRQKGLHIDQLFIRTFKCCCNIVLVYPQYRFDD